MLPIDSKKSLILGSNDGSRTFVDKTDAETAKTIERISSKLNLSNHRIFTRSGPSFNTFLPIDLEVHKSLQDGKIYMLDFARLCPAEIPPTYSLDPHPVRAYSNEDISFPPSDPEPTKSLVPRASHLVFLMRPEFVKNYRFSTLCSDGFSRFIVDPIDKHNQSHLEHNNKLAQAWAHLVARVIPDFARHLCHTKRVYRVVFPPIRQEFHARGINLRYLGLVRQFVLYYSSLAPKSEEGEQTEGEYWALMLLVEMVARVIKHQMKAMARSKGSDPSESRYRIELINQMNVVFGESPESDHFWASEISPSINHKFPSFEAIHKTLQSILSKEDLAQCDFDISHLLAFRPSLFAHQSIAPGDLKRVLSHHKCSQRIKFDGRFLLMRSVSSMMGMWTSQALWSRASAPQTAFFRSRRPFSELDLENVREKISYMSVVSFAEGFMYYSRVLLLSEDFETKADIQRQLLLAAERFEKALNSQPDEPNALLHMSLTLTALSLTDRAEGCFQSLMASTSPTPFSLTSHALFYESVGRFAEAEEKLLAALHLCPQYVNGICLLADFWWQYDRTKMDLVLRLYEKALELDPSCVPARHNLSLLRFFVSPPSSCSSPSPRHDLTLILDDLLNLSDHPVIHRNRTLSLQS